LLRMHCYNAAFLHEQRLNDTDDSAQ